MTWLVQEIWLWMALAALAGAVLTGFFSTTEIRTERWVPTPLPEESDIEEPVPATAFEARPAEAQDPFSSPFPEITTTSGARPWEEDELWRRPVADADASFAWPAEAADVLRPGKDWDDWAPETSAPAEAPVSSTVPVSPVSHEEQLWPEEPVRAETEDASAGLDEETALEAVGPVPDEHVEVVTEEHLDVPVEVEAQAAPGTTVEELAAAETVAGHAGDSESADEPAPETAAEPEPAPEPETEELSAAEKIQLELARLEAEMEKREQRKRELEEVERLETERAEAERLAAEASPGAGGTDEQGDVEATAEVAPAPAAPRKPRTARKRTAPKDAPAPAEPSSEQAQDQAQEATPELTPEQLEAERLEAERLQAERAARAKARAERAAATRARRKAERVEQERLEQERVEQERVEAERLEAEKARRKAERAAAARERARAKRAEAARLKAERAEQERAEAERAEAERAEAERAEAERAEAERMDDGGLAEELLSPEPSPTRPTWLDPDDDSDAWKQGPFGPGSAYAPFDGAAPRGCTVKANMDTMLYHSRKSRFYSRARADVWFEDEEHAEAAGFTRWDKRGSLAHAVTQDPVSEGPAA